LKFSKGAIKGVKIQGRVVKAPEEEMKTKYEDYGAEFDSPTNKGGKAEPAIEVASKEPV
jgi:hypothetical protein